MEEPRAWTSSSRSVPAALRLDYLTVHPAALRASQEGDDSGDIVGLSETAERNVARQTLDELFRLAGQEQLCSDWPRRDHVDGDGALAEFLRKDMGHRFYRRLGRRVDAIGGKVITDDARREVGRRVNN